MSKKSKHIYRAATADERAHQARIRKLSMQEYPPVPSRLRPSPPGIPSRIRETRLAQGLSWYALAKKAGVPNQSTVRDIEVGKDVRLSNIEAVAAALGLHLELVAQEA